MSLDAAPQTKSVEPAKAAAPAARSGVFKLFKPYFYITAYYAGLGFVLMLAIALNRDLLNFLPLGGSLTMGQGLEFEAVAAPATTAGEVLEASAKLALAIISAFLLMLPVTWICMGARRRKDVTQSFVQTILVLPMAITGIVHLVHDSLALAFSLAGIVAGVRFRHTLKDSAETTYLFTAISVGVACGINAVEVAAIISSFFNYTVLGLWAVEYGQNSSGKQMFSSAWMSGVSDDDGDKKKKDKKDRESDDDDD